MNMSIRSAQTVNRKIMEIIINWFFGAALLHNFLFYRKNSYKNYLYFDLTRQEL